MTSGPPNRSGSALSGGPTNETCGDRRPGRREAIHRVQVKPSPGQISGNYTASWFPAQATAFAVPLVDVGIQQENRAWIGPETPAITENRHAMEAMMTPRPQKLRIRESMVTRLEATILGTFAKQRQGANRGAAILGAPSFLAAKPFVVLSSQRRGTDSGPHPETPDAPRWHRCWEVGTCTISTYARPDPDQSRLGSPPPVAQGSGRESGSHPRGACAGWVPNPQA